MINKIKGINIKNLRIRSKKDWVIFWIFSTLVVYVMCGSVNGRINNWLRTIGSEWMTNLNEPQSYGQIFATTVAMAILVELVLFLCRKPLKSMVLTLVAAVVVPMLIIGCYQLHCELIVSVLWKEEPRTVWADFGQERICLKQGSEVGENGDKWKEALILCQNLTPLPKEEQEKCLEWYKSADSPFMETPMISLYFEEKYGHSYLFQLRLYEGYVYLWRGYSSEKIEITFFEDNGITQWLEELKE